MKHYIMPILCHFSANSVCIRTTSIKTNFITHPRIPKNPITRRALKRIRTPRGQIEIYRAIFITALSAAVTQTYERLYEF